jgi:tRNA(Ile)-lysidine synthase
MQPADAPFSTHHCAQLFRALTQPFAIAVSGGADSIALMHLIATWRQTLEGAQDPGPPLILTVDHGLRPESAAEASVVRAQALSLGFAHETLVWTGPKPETGLQDAARQARYERLFARLAIEGAPRCLVTAHTQDDQAETLLMRLARGSGLTGLSAMRTNEQRTIVQTRHPICETDIMLHRPLLAVPKAHLVRYLVDRDVPWIDDPSNQNVAFERVRLRAAASALLELGFTSQRIALSARRLQDEGRVLQSRRQTQAAAHIEDHDGAFGTLAVGPIGALLPADIVRLLVPLLEVFGGASRPAQLSQIETLVDRLGDRSSHAAGGVTLGGCLIDIVDAGDERLVHVFREYQRTPLPHVTLAPGDGVFWDQRFYISLAPEAPTPVRVGPMGNGTGGDPAKSLGSTRLSNRSRAGLPALFDAQSSAPRMLFGTKMSHIPCTWPRQHWRRLRGL